MDYQEWDAAGDCGNANADWMNAEQQAFLRVPTAETNTDGYGFDGRTVVADIAADSCEVVAVAVDVLGDDEEVDDGDDHDECGVENSDRHSLLHDYYVDLYCCCLNMCKGTRKDR